MALPQYSVWLGRQQSPGTFVGRRCSSCLPRHRFAARQTDRLSPAALLLIGSTGISWILTVDYHELMKPFEEAGSWWLPSREDRAVAGRLRFSHGSAGIRLELIGSLQGDDWKAYPASRYPSVLGRTVSGKEVTLCQCVCVITNATGPPGEENVTVVEEVEARQLLFGAHFPEGNAATFREVELDFEHLGEWAAVEGSFGRPHRVDQTDEGDSDGFRTGIQFRVPPALEVEVPAATIRISYGMREELGLHDYVARRMVRVSFRLTEAATSDEIRDRFLRPLQYFLTFACDAPCHVLAMRFTNELLGRRYGDHWVPTWIEAVHSNWPEATGEPQRSFEMLLPLSAVRDRLRPILQRWFQDWNDLRNAFDLLFTDILGPRLYLETHFLLLAQAAEVYHRRRFPGGVLSKEEHRQRKAAIFGAVEDEGLAGWLKEKLAYSNEPTMRQRMERVFDHAGPQAQSLVRHDFAKVVADTRNYLTHYDARLKDKAAKGESLYWLSIEVFTLLQLCLLQDLGVEEMEAWRLLRQTHRCRVLLDPALRV